MMFSIVVIYFLLRYSLWSYRYKLIIYASIPVCWSCRWSSSWCCSPCLHSFWSLLVFWIVFLFFLTKCLLRPHPYYSHTGSSLSLCLFRPSPSLYYHIGNAWASIRWFSGYVATTSTSSPSRIPVAILWWLGAGREVLLCWGDARLWLMFSF